MEIGYVINHEFTNKRLGRYYEKDSGIFKTKEDALEKLDDIEEYFRELEKEKNTYVIYREKEKLTTFCTSNGGENVFTLEPRLNLEYVVNE